MTIPLTDPSLLPAGAQRWYSPGFDLAGLLADHARTHPDRPVLAVAWEEGPPQHWTVVEPEGEKP